MNIYSIFPLIAIFANLIACFYVLFINPKNNLNRFFGFFTLSLGIWSLGNYFTFNAAYVSEAFFWNNIATIGSVLTSISLFHFALIYSKNKLAFNKIFLLLIYLSGFFIILVEFTTNLITSTMYPAYWGIARKAGPLYIILTLYIMILIIVSLFTSYTIYKKTSSKEVKKQTFSLIFAVSIPLIGGIITQVLTPILEIEVIPLTSSLTTITAVVICFSIFRYGFISPMSFSIQKKFIASFLVIILSLTFVFFFVSFYYQNEQLINQADYEIEIDQDKFNTLFIHESYCLGAALEVIVQDKVLMDCYLEKNRTKLYDCGQTLFQNLKDDYGITHFNFIEINGSCFVRLQNKDIYGDEITRYTYCNANDTMNVSYGLELGKTAFALRVVRPYYNGSQHIGFVELGQDIDYLFTYLQGRSLSEYALIVDKQYLDEDKWESVRNSNGLRNNWDDLENYLVIMETLEENSELYQPCMSGFLSENVDEVIDKKHTPKIIQHKEKTFVCGGFLLVDSGNREVGVVFSLIDITDYALITQTANNLNIFSTIIIAILAISMAVLISRNISKPILNLSNTAKKIGEGNLDVEAKIKTNDEIGQLSYAFNKMVESLKMNNENLEQKVNKRTSELQQKIKELEDFKKVIVGREIKMIGLKKEIKQLKENNKPGGNNFNVN